MALPFLLAAVFPKAPQGVVYSGKGPVMKTLTICFIAWVLSPSIALAQKLDVKVLHRQDSDQSYEYATYFTGQSAGQAAGATFHVTGAALTLQLPDGRVVVVNCTDKFAEKMRGPVGNHRSCRVPLACLIHES